MQRVLVILLVSLGGSTLAAELEVPTCDSDIVRDCQKERGITLEYIIEHNQATNRCFDAFEQDENYRCYHECLLQRLMERYGFDLYQLFEKLYCAINPTRLKYLFEHCSKMISESDIVEMTCGINYAIHRCIRMHLNVYPPGAHPPSFCRVQPPTKKECIARAEQVQSDFCQLSLPGWLDSNVTDVDMCYEVCLLRGMNYIIGTEVNIRVWYDLAYPFLPRVAFDIVYKNCVNTVQKMKLTPTPEDSLDCAYFYQLFKCVQFYLGPDNDGFLITKG